jgi:hypothetical protein
MCVTDQICPLNAVFDACLAEDPDSKVACQTCTKTNMVMVFGEITTKANVDYSRPLRIACLRLSVSAVAAVSREPSPSCAAVGTRTPASADRLLGSEGRILDHAFLCSHGGIESSSSQSST